MRPNDQIERRAILGAAIMAIAADGEPPGVRSEELLSATSSWDGAAYPRYPEGTPQLSVRRITIPARGELQWHAHPMPSAAYVLAGEITVISEKDGRQRHFKAGQVIPETVNSGHRGFVGDEQAVFIVFYAGVTGMELSIQNPSNRRE